MFSLFSLKLCGCFGVRKKRRKPGTNLKEVYQSGSLASFKTKKTVRFKPQEERLTKDAKAHHQTGSDEDVKQDPSSAPSQKPNVIQGVKPNIVLVEGIKCRSQLKCKARPGGYVGPGCSIALGERKLGNKQIFHTWLFLEAGWWLYACLYSLLLHFHVLFFG